MEHQYPSIIQEDVIDFIDGGQMHSSASLEVNNLMCDPNIAIGNNSSNGGDASIGSNDLGVIAAGSGNLVDLLPHQTNLPNMNLMQCQGEITHQLIPSQGYSSSEMVPLPLLYLPYEAPRQEDLIPGSIMDQKIEITNKLQCTTCGKQYSRKQSLDKHVQCHLPEKQWVCEYEGCELRFKLKEYLKSHQKVHTRALIGENTGAKFLHICFELLCSLLMP
jgi:uncharacterized Zn-finger protein